MSREFRMGRDCRCTRGHRRADRVRREAVARSGRLPPLFAVTRAAGTMTKLQQVRSSMSHRPTSDAIARAFGVFREDAIYLLPIPIPKEGAELSVLFHDSTAVMAGASIRGF